MRRIVALACFTLILSTAPARAWDRACFVNQAVVLEGRYFREVQNPSVGAGWTYTAVPPVAMTISTFYNVPVTITEVFTRTIFIPPPPHTETFTRTMHTFTTVYTDVVETLGFAPAHIVTDADLGLRFTAPTPFAIYHCAPGIAPHTFLPLVHRPAISAVVARPPIERRSHAP